MALVATLVAGACSPGGVVTSGSASSTATGSGFGVGDSNAFTIIGPEGGPFEGGRRTYSLVNSSTTRTITWRVEATTPWLLFSEQGGMLGPGAMTEVVATLDQVTAAGLHEGDYPADIVFRDTRSEYGDVYLAFLLRILPTPDGAPLWVSPEDDIDVTGEVGGELDADSVTYALINQGKKSLDWEVSVDQPWMLLPERWAGSLQAGETDEVVLGLDAQTTRTLAAGRYVAETSFEVTSGPAGSVLSRRVNLTLSDPSEGGRVVDGLLALYDFEQPAAMVRDVSGVEPKHDLAIEDVSTVQWLPGVLRLESPARLVSPGPATKIVEACKASNEITVEAWITPDNLTQDGPARVATISNGAYERDVTLGQGLWGGQPSDTYNVRLRSTSTDQDGMPLVTTPAGAARLELQHVVYTRDSHGGARVYVDGELSASGTVGGNLSNWDASFRLALGNELGAWRPWLGDLHLVAVYGRALGADEVQQNLDAGAGDVEAGHLVVDPSAPFTITGVEGSTFSASEKTYTLTNPGPEPIDWSAEVSEPWIYLDTQGGGLAPGAETRCTVYLDLARVMTFSPGHYEAAIEFTNETNDLGSTTRLVLLTVKSEDDDGWDGEKPGPHNTGPTDEELLVPSGSITVTQNGAVVENVRVSGMIHVKADNVTIRNFIVVGNGSPYGIRCDYGYNNTRIEDGELVDCASAGIFGRGFTARRLEVHEMGADGLKCRGDNLVEACWIHHLGLTEGAHADGNQTRSGSGITLRGNFFDMPVGQSGGYKSNACSINQAELGDIDDLVMEGNWLNGGNFTVYFTAMPDKGHKMTNCKLIYNRFGRDYKFGVLKQGGNVFNLEIHGNVWDDTGEDMDIND